MSRETFDALWHPVAERLQLAWVPMMGTGFTVLPHDIPAILEELDRLDRALRTHPPKGVPASQVQLAVERVDHLRTQLKALTATPDVDAYLG